MKSNREQELMCALGKIDHEGCKTLLQALTNDWDDCIDDLETMQIRGQISLTIQHQEQSDITLKAITLAHDKNVPVEKDETNWFVYIVPAGKTEPDYVPIMKWYEELKGVE
jgi:hypothetical protein